MPPKEALGLLRVLGQTTCTNVWQRPERPHKYVGTLLNAYLAEGGRALGITAGESYFDIGTLEGYRAAVSRLGATAGRPA